MDISAALWAYGWVWTLHLHFKYLSLPFLIMKQIGFYHFCDQSNRTLTAGSYAFNVLKMSELPVHEFLHSFYFSLHFYCDFCITSTSFCYF